MERRDNYAIAAAEARKLFLNYDHEKLANKLKCKLDDDYLYVQMLNETYRIHRATGDISRFHNMEWVEANSFEESLTLLDLVCDSKENRFLTGRWKNLRDFGLQFHRNLTEEYRDPRAEQFQMNPELLVKACEALEGSKYSVGDIAYSVEIFDGLSVLIQLWYGDDEFPPVLNWLWDDNALLYLKYETMYYAINLIMKRLQENM